MVRRFCILAVTKPRMLRSLARRETGRAGSFAVISLIWRSRSTRATLSAGPGGARSDLGLPAHDLSQETVPSNLSHDKNIMATMCLGRPRYSDMFHSSKQLRCQTKMLEPCHRNKYYGGISS
jgi:hypothetical protein